MLSRLFAVWLLTLIVLPFTAPFRAWDSGTPIGKPSSSDLKASDEFSNSTGIAAAAVSIVPVTRSVIVRRVAADGSPARPQTLHLVLRL